MKGKSNNTELSNFLFYILKKWRIILVIAVVLGVLSIVYWNFHLNNSAKIFEEPIYDESEIESVEIPDVDKRAIEAFIVENNPEMIRLQAELNQLEKVNKNLNEKLATNLLLNTNPDELKASEMVLQIQIDSPDSNVSTKDEEKLIANNFYGNLKNASFYAYVERETELQIPSNQVSNMIFLQTENDSDIRITLISPEAIMDKFIEVVQNYINFELPTSLFSRAFFSTNLSEIKEVAVPIESQNKGEIVSEINKNYSDILAMNKQIEDTKETLLEEEFKNKQYEILQKEFEEEQEQFKQLEDENQGHNQSKTGKLLQLIKRFVIGAIVGIILTLIYFAAKILINNKMVSNAEITNELGLFTIGTLYLKNENKRNNVIDTLINRIFYPDKLFSSEYLTLENTKINNLTKLLINENEGNNANNNKIGILCDGYVSLDSIKLQDAFQGIDYIGIDSGSANQLLIEQISEIDYLILLLNERHNNLAEMKLIFEICKKLDKTILGAISMDIV